MQLRRSQHLSATKSGPQRRRFQVLLVESDLLDVRLFEESFRALKITHELTVVSSRSQAIRLLAGRNSRCRLIDLVLIGVSAVDRDKFDLLTAIRANAILLTMPVIILASSSNAADVHRAYELGANSYLVKPANDFVDLIGDLDRFWFRRAELPLRSRT
jgi:CheY-like chemotaxis protein